MKICPLKTLKQHRYGDVVSSKDLDFGSELQQPEKWKTLKEKAELQHHFRIVNSIEKHNIPKVLVLNSDQVSSKYVTVGCTIMTPKTSTRVGLAESTDKRSITLTLTVTLDGKVLPFQTIYGAIYGGKIDQSIPKITFPAKFSESVNEKHYNNTGEVINHLQEIFIPYVNEKREKIRDADQHAPLIWDVLRGQKTEAVISLLKEQKNIERVYTKQYDRLFPGAKISRSTNG